MQLVMSKAELARGLGNHGYLTHSTYTVDHYNHMLLCTDKQYSEVMYNTDDVDEDNSEADADYTSISTCEMWIVKQFS